MRFFFCMSAKTVTLKSTFIPINWNWKKTPFWILHVWKVELKELIWNEISLRLLLDQPVFTCSILIIETVQNMFKVNYKDTRTTSMIFWQLCFWIGFEQILYTVLHFNYWLFLFLFIISISWPKYFYL